MRGVPVVPGHPGNAITKVNQLHVDGKNEQVTFCRDKEEGGRDGGFSGCVERSGDSSLWKAEGGGGGDTERRELVSGAGGGGGEDTRFKGSFRGGAGAGGDSVCSGEDTVGLNGGLLS